MTTRLLVNSFRRHLAKKSAHPTMLIGDAHLSEQQTFADWLRRHMGSRSHRALALKVGVSPTTIGNWLIGTLPDLNNVRLLTRLADELQVSRAEVEQAIRNDQQLREVREATRIVADQDIRVLLRANRRLSEDSIRRIVEFVERVEREDQEHRQDGQV